MLCQVEPCMTEFHCVSADCESCVSACAVSSSCSTATRTTSRGDDAAKDAYSDSDTSAAMSDDEHTREVENLASVQWHLELMNAAAEDTNAAQNTLNAHMQEKHAQMKQWAVTSARLARSVGAERLEKARPWLQADRACRTARTDVAEASEEYMIALEAGESESTLSDMMARHALALAKYQTAEQALGQVQKKKKFLPARVAALRPYVEAEDEHGVRMAEIHAKIKQSVEHLNSAKQRYRKALRSLEELSEETHRRRSVSQTEDDV